MEYKELEKMTVVKLREEAAKFEDIVGTHGMHKDQLLDILCQKYNIDRSHHVPTGIGRRAMKTRLKALRGQLGDVRAGGDKKKLRIHRRRVSRLNRRLRKVIHKAERAEAAAAAASKSSGEAPAESA